MDKGTKVYRAYIAITPGLWWIDEGEATEIVMDGKQLIRVHNALVPMDLTWHQIKGSAKADVVRALAKQIGAMQAKLDTVRDEMLHESLMQDEAQREPELTQCSN
jgi:hypothetical protein